MRIEILYFAWLRERIGVPRESIETDAATVMDLVNELRQRDERYAVAFQDVSAVRVALDQVLNDFAADISGSKEIAFFPPMTGG